MVLRLANEADGLGSSGSGIVVDREGEGGVRDTLGRITPDESQNLLGICALRERGRVAIPGVCRVEQVVAHLRNRGQDYALGTAQHSRLGPLGGDFIANGGSVDLQAGDLVELTYQPSAESLGDASTWYLLVLRQGTTPPIPFSQRPSREESLPERFALYANQPNPAGTSTVIRFDLPRASSARLEVFDLLGRHVVTLADGMYPAGRHAKAWDLRDGSGAPLRPGVYVYRLVAGEFRAQRKLGVLP